ncbi:MAG: hypothetical protein MUO97_07395 [Dehalococcoidia bacterium]|nr:hypothetical protein [Dehalococcoidia bacterium]
MESISYPQDFLGGSFDLSPYETLKRNRNYAITLLTQINASLNKKYGDGDGFCIAVAGSYGRLEASELSDIDLFIVHDDIIDKRKADILRERALLEIRSLCISVPNPRGVFVEPSHLGTLIENIGSFDDPVRQLSQRMLLLMESRPLYNGNFFRNAIKKLINRYCEYVVYNPEKEFVVLLNEVIKYFRTICLNYQFTFWRENEQWPIRNLKLRHSRIVMYGGLLLLVLNASKYGRAKCNYLEEHISFTPLENICHVYLDNDEDPAQFLPFYEKFLSMMSDKKVRENLIGLGYLERYKSDYYKELKDNSDKLCSELTRFVLSRRGVWTDSAFEYLLF